MSSPQPVIPQVRGFLISLGLFNDENVRRQVVETEAALDSRLIAQITFRGDALGFVDECIKHILPYGRLENGSDAFESFLLAVKNRVGVDRGIVIDRLIEDWKRSVSQISLDPAALSSTVAKQATSPADVESISVGLRALSRLMRRPQVRNAAMRFQLNLEHAEGQIESLRGYKGLHDALHDMQFKCQDLIRSEIGSFPNDPSGLDNVQDYLFTLDRLAQEVRSIVEKGHIRAEETRWIEEDLEPARKELWHAWSTRDLEALRRGDLLLNRVVARRPSEINFSLYRAAETLRLPDLLDALRRISNEVVLLGAHSEDLELFEEGIEHLSAFSTVLRSLVGQHYQWQEVDNELRLINESLRTDKEELAFWWPRLKVKVVPLCHAKADSWSPQLGTNIERLDMALESQEPGKILEQFRRFRAQARDRFYDVDKALKSQCDLLPMVAEPLDAVLRLMQ